MSEGENHLIFVRNRFSGCFRPLPLGHHLDHVKVCGIFNGWLTRDSGPRRIWVPNGTPDVNNLLTFRPPNDGSVVCNPVVDWMKRASYYS